MLVILSDLHFCDGTATDRNIAPKAFKLALGDIYDLASQVARDRGRATDIDILVLGDVVDLLRTTRWFEDASGAEVPIEERPWGTEAALGKDPPSSAVLTRARGILSEIVAKNQDALATLQGKTLTKPAGVGRVRRLYIPGNHDRLYLHDKELHKGILDALDARELGQDEGGFAHRIELPQYGLLARHGHEWDGWNFESFREGALASQYADEDYLPTPIGDPITTELVARLPYELDRRLRGDGMPEKTCDDILRRMQRIDDVRPVLASFQWAFFEAERINGQLPSAQASLLRGALDATAAKIAEDFLKLDYHAAWRSKHHGFLRPDMPVKLDIVLEALRAVHAHTLFDLAVALTGVGAKKDPRDECEVGAAKESLDAVVKSPGLRHVVYGHTHEPLQAPLRATSSNQDIYLNSGTFRQAVFRTDDDNGFVGWERMTYLCFYQQDEAARDSKDKRVGPSFESWTGARSRGMIVT
jgi:UDP-2,3-diacylglucosamine pyrophosphatase LpxH